MQRIFLIAGIVLFNLSIHAQVKKQTQKKWVTVSGKVQFLNPPGSFTNAGYDFNKVYVGKGYGRNYVAIDSVAVKPDGSYSIKIDATIPSFYRIDFVKWDRIEFFADGDAVVNVR